ncbi:polysaccharide pyruvyl transferase family protein [Bacteroides sp. 224]|uniref:polysaccharide pyruvyl transferase family protein n=1 Tax=Bacteroides sp. 224 TaxID=2302936 RepID=UPI0013D4BD0D|nr:polysaccharide pyruvyl transferase family protein [Bacteroides sp. 224]NDV65189.1 polysaccharide pyruvyl transferase family protein [Bacteroides sp. 224]
MNIGILTQPLRNNYGGILQAFALQTTLQRMNHTVWVLNRDYPKISVLRESKVILKNIIKRYVFRRKNTPIIPPYLFLLKEKKEICSKTLEFINLKINRTEVLRSDNELRKAIRKYNIHACIVGSDQVWRPKYSPYMPNFFFNFIRPTENIKRIAFAASFGVDKWEFSEEETILYSTLIKHFDAVSVREKSGITMLEKYLNYHHAKHILDPTLLLEKDSYIQLTKEANEPAHCGEIMLYILDSDVEKNRITDEIAQALNMKTFTTMPDKVLSEETKYDLIACTYPPVTNWLQGFMDAKFIITDSFHGCIFSIIFNKPFIAIGNEERGLERFNSLLDTFELGSRLINISKEREKPIHSLIAEEINWNKVNKIREERKLKAIDFLQRNLSI